MRDKMKIFAGVAIFLAVALFPLWYVRTTGKASIVPEPKLVNAGKECVNAKEYMREYHMTMLNEWRDEVVREGRRAPIVIAGVEYQKSLSDACMKCHANKTDFCDVCHNYLGVSPTCWDCHNSPKEPKHEIR